jgi:hypothetical protein
MTEATYVICYKHRSEWEDENHSAFTILRGNEPYDGMLAINKTTPSGIPMYCYPEDLEYFQNKEGDL